MWDAYTANGNILLARFLQDLGNGTLLLELEVHLGLVGFDFNQHISGGDGVSGLLLPRSDVSGRHRRGEGGHADDGVRGESCG